MQCPPRPGPGIEWHEAERLGLRRVDHFPDVDAHRVVDDLQLVDQRDVDARGRCSPELDGFGDLADDETGTTLIDDRAVERDGQRRSASASTPPTTFGNVSRAEVRVAGIFALRREGEEEVLAAPAARSASRMRLQHLARSCRDRSSISSTTSCPRRRCGAIVRAVFATYDRSGSRCVSSGVGTQMMIASAWASSAKSAVARKRCVCRMWAIFSPGMVSMMPDLPALRPSTFRRSISKPSTLKPTCDGPRWQAVVRRNPCR